MHRGCDRTISRSRLHYLLPNIDLYTLSFYHFFEKKGLVDMVVIFEYIAPDIYHFTNNLFFTK